MDTEETIRGDVRRYIEKYVAIPNQFFVAAMEIVWAQKFATRSGSSTIDQFSFEVDTKSKALIVESNQKELDIQESQLYIQRYVDMVESALFCSSYIVRIFEYCYDKLEENPVGNHGCMVEACCKVWELGVVGAERYFLDLATSFYPEVIGSLQSTPAGESSSPF